MMLPRVDEKKQREVALDDLAKAARDLSVGRRSIKIPIVRKVRRGPDGRLRVEAGLGRRQEIQKPSATPAGYRVEQRDVWKINALAYLMVALTRIRLVGRERAVAIVRRYHMSKMRPV